MKNINRLDNIPSCEQICVACYNLKYGKSCDNQDCNDTCPFDSIENCIIYLKKEYGGSLKLKQFEYDMLTAFIESYDVNNGQFADFTWIARFQAKGYLQNIDLNMIFDEFMEKDVIIDD